jgi:hypothetical protein
MWPSKYHVYALGQSPLDTARLFSTIVQATNGYTHHGDGSAEGANSKSTDEAADGELLPNTSCSDLDDNTNNKQDTFKNHGISSAEKVGRTEQYQSDNEGW